VISGKQKPACRDLADVELNAVREGWEYVWNPPTATGMSIANQNAIARSQELSAIYIANHPIQLPH
jgi:hypothetical protein